VEVVLVPVGAPTPGDVAPACPSPQRSFPIGGLIDVEVWASAGVSETGLAAVYASVRFDPIALRIADVAPSESFSLFTIDQPLSAAGMFVPTGTLCRIGGCVQPGEKRLGADSQWVRVATLRLRARSAGSSTIHLLPADGGYGIALIDQLNLLPAESVALGTCRVEVRKMVAHSVEAPVSESPEESGRP
jgi:hypothetical protein